MEDLFHRFSEIYKTAEERIDKVEPVGYSCGGLPLYGYVIGTGGVSVSLIAGCHSDEPVGPHFLRRLVNYLTSLDCEDPLLKNVEWWIVPHINPDGEQKNAAWFNGTDLSYSLPSYLRHVFREPPGDDIEFGFPRFPGDSGCRPETRSIYNWWRENSKPFKLHVSLHGMTFGYGPWFLLEQTWIFRTIELREKCKSLVRRMGYTLHDVDRHGEKGFFRIDEGFCTRPDSGYMVQYFKEKGDEKTAAKFRPSSMETIRSLYPDALTLVTEVPLFLIPPGKSEFEDQSAWKEKKLKWQQRLRNGAPAESILQEADQIGIRTMPVKDQMMVQWRYITAGIEKILKKK